MITLPAHQIKKIVILSQIYNLEIILLYIYDLSLSETVFKKYKNLAWFLNIENDSIVHYFANLYMLWIFGHYLYTNDWKKPWLI